MGASAKKRVYSYFFEFPKHTFLSSYEAGCKLSLLARIQLQGYMNTCTRIPDGSLATDELCRHNFHT